jgi:catechol 2,3-dioxygenase-like lactoylglutathione lyase family enzyme
MATTIDARLAVVRMDHGVFPSNDLGQSLVFFTDVLGAQFNRLVNVNLRGINREVPEIAFFTLANHRGCGVALQEQPIPAPVRPLEGPVWGFEVDNRGLGSVAEALRQRGVSFEGPVEYAAPSPIATSIFLCDPDGFSYELSTRSSSTASTGPSQGHLGLRRISHVRLEVTDLNEASHWYRETLGLESSAEVPGERQTTLAVGATGQLFVLREVPAMTQRSHYSRGPHVDVKVPVGSFEPFAARLTNVERYWGPLGGHIPWHEPDPKTIYFYDPFGNRLQVSEDRPHR